MQRQNAGWFQGSEGSKGEALSRFLSAQFLFLNDLASAPYPGFNVASLWLNPPSARHDFVNNNPDDNKPDPVTGCTTLYLYYLHDQLGFSTNAIIAAGASNLSGVYQNLVGEPDGWTPFIRLVDSHYPRQSATGTPFVYNPPGDSIFPVAELSALFPPNQITCGYSEPAQVFIDRSVPTEVNIALTSDDPSVVQVPPVVIIPAGSLSTSFDVKTTALPIPFPPKFVTIRATYAGKTLTTSVEVVPPAVARVALSPDTVVSGSSANGTVTLNRPSMRGPVAVEVSSSAPGYARVSPTTVVIPQGSQTATFVITAPASVIPFGTAHAEITATYSGRSTSARLTVKSSVVASTLASLTLLPPTVTGGHTSRGTVTLERAVATDTLVALAAVEAGPIPSPITGHSSTVAHVPQSVLIRAGETSAFFTITTGEILAHTTRRVTIMAWATVQKSAVLTITG
jgi:hypothetical protein